MTHPNPFRMTRDTQLMPTSSSLKAISAAMQKDAELYAMALREDGLLRGTLVATGTGWRKIETLQPGDMVLTFDNGMQPVTRIHDLTIPYHDLPTHKAFIMIVPRGVLGNRRQIELLPLQEIIIESDFAEEQYGDPFVLVQALMLEGFDGIHRVPLKNDLRVYLPTFPQEQLVHTCGMALLTARAESDFSPLDASVHMARREYTRLPYADLTALAASLKQERAA
ncbi:Hint domain-containing protein [Roseinatronobacter sp.]|uniref:Hint domain-containing protein n=1 Tax=Roseinatronobacter sp. TaxID=1945755 RepID=UPI0025F0AA22|nr:Hint domain-containing protein [Roseibaca sp.]